ncbi:MAG: hypothetical protein R2769_05300 [Saprospiraceae bacterium]
MGVNKGEYALMTMHRPSNVDHKAGLEKMMEVIEHIQIGNSCFPNPPQDHEKVLKNSEWMED